MSLTFDISVSSLTVLLTSTIIGNKTLKTHGMYTRKVNSRRLKWAKGKRNFYPGPALLSTSRVKICIYINAVEF